MQDVILTLTVECGEEVKVEVEVEVEVPKLASGMAPRTRPICKAE